MKNMLKTKRTSGFTIIEVMIVLAIAGLIMVIVFLAVPQLQRNQRDNARQSIVNRLKAEIENYASNNQGRYPFGPTLSSSWGTECKNMGSKGTTGACADFYSRYISGTGSTPLVNTNDPTTGDPTVVQISSSAGLPSWSVGHVWVSVGNQCNGENLQAGTGGVGSNSRRYAIITALDKTDTWYCVDNG